MEIKVSVVVPIYNVEKYLDRCMASLLNQTLHDIEIILVDDGAKDSCPQKCDDYAVKDERVKVIHKANSGLGFARNSGLAVARGEYVAFVDSDDFIELNAFEKLYNKVTSSCLDAVIADFNVDGYNGFSKYRNVPHLYSSKQEVERLVLDMIGAEPTFKSCSKIQYSVWLALYKLSLIKENNVQFRSEREVVSEDILFNIDFYKHASRVEIIDEAFYHYCYNGASLSHSYRSDRWEKFLVLLNLFKSSCSHFTDQKELDLRIGRSALAFAKISAEQEVLRTDIGIKSKLSQLSNIIGNTSLSMYLKKYPVRQLPIRWRLFAYLIIYRCSLLVYLLLCKQNIRKI